MNLALRSIPGVGQALSASLAAASLATPALNSESECARPTSRSSGIEADCAVVGRVLNGNEEAARALVERLYPIVLKLVRCHLPRRIQEEDLAQAVFAKIFHKLHQFSGRVPLEHWVSRIAINTCLNQLKREIARPELRLSDLNEEEQAVVQRLATHDEDLPGERAHAARELLEKLLSHLRPDQRLVITLLHLEERSTDEVSRATGWSISLVKVKAFRARRQLHFLWKTLFNGEKP